MPQSVGHQTPYFSDDIQDALAIALKLALAVPLADIMAYRKVGRAFFQLLEVLSHNHAPVLASTDTTTFAFLVCDTFLLGGSSSDLLLVLSHSRRRLHLHFLSWLVFNLGCAKLRTSGRQIRAHPFTCRFMLLQMLALDAGQKCLDMSVSSQCA